jgi:5-formyltetrahydrofolate cyclo-ligase
MFIPDYQDSDKCAEKMRRTKIYKSSQLAMITPDNNLMKLREYLLCDGKNFIIPTYGIGRGFFLMKAKVIPPKDYRFASTLDGCEIFGSAVNLHQLIEFKKIDFMVTGASVVHHNGVRYGKGHGYFDIEWALFNEIGIANETTPIFAVVHDSQLIQKQIIPSPHDTCVDFIVTPTQIIEVKEKYPKPKKIHWNILPSDMYNSIPPLQELKRLLNEENK